MNKPELSIVIPVYNEEAVLTELFARLYKSLDALTVSYEVLFINDGSRDRSAAMLSEQFQLRPEVTRVVNLHNNHGQYMALLAGFEASRGDMVITLDADLQNPPEDIGKLVAKMQEGHDYVGTIRAKRGHSLWRHKASRFMNWVRERITSVRLTDHGCMLRGYSRRITDMINNYNETNIFIPALGYSFATNPTEIEVGHAERFAGDSKYSLYGLIRLSFDLVTGFSVAPLQWLSFIGILLSSGSAALFILLTVRRLILGAELEGVFTLFAITFFLLGVILFSLGLLGEYIGRIYQQVSARPRYFAQTRLEQISQETAPQASTLPATLNAPKQ